jgi:hypothetical protein
MSVRKRLWQTAAGEERQAWLCDYTGQSGKRHVKTFARKKDADAFIAEAKVEVREGVHTADSDSVTIRDAADLWLTTGAARRLERATLAAYERLLVAGSSVSKEIPEKGQRGRDWGAHDGETDWPPRNIKLALGRNHEQKA